jgi:hypothetical protein
MLTVELDHATTMFRRNLLKVLAGHIAREIKAWGETPRDNSDCESGWREAVNALRCVVGARWHWSGPEINRMFREAHGHLERARTSDPSWGPLADRLGAALERDAIMLFEWLRQEVDNG